jgi:hypothetical protein
LSRPVSIADGATIKPEEGQQRSVGHGRRLDADLAEYEQHGGDRVRADRDVGQWRVRRVAGIALEQAQQHHLGSPSNP